MENPQIQLIKKSELYKLTVTQELEKKIRFLCDKLPHNEWSGTLFYTIEGSFEDNNLHVICKDFFLQDVGESTYTEFQNDVDLAGYIAEHELWDCYTGLMHSHNTMATWMSGTDINTLRDEGAQRNHFVSIIVNNAGTYTAAITKKVKSVFKGTNIVEYNTFDNVTINGKAVPFEEEKSYIEYYYLEITKEEIPITPKSELELRLEEVRKSAKSYINRKIGVPYNVSSNYKQPAQEYKYPTFFIEEEMGKSKESLEPKNLELDPSVAYDDDHINPTILENTVKQIITGDIFSIYKQNIDLDKWAINMEKLYDKRFANSKSEFDSFEYWADTLLECMENELYDEKLIQKGREYMDAIWAWDTIVRLQDYPENKYIDKFINSLERWLI